MAAITMTVACGSTVQLPAGGQGPAAAELGGDSLELGPDGTAAAGGGKGLAPGGAGSGAAPDGASGSGTHTASGVGPPDEGAASEVGGGGGDGSAVAPVGGAGKPAGGAATDPIKVGLVVITDLNEGFAALGYDADLGDQEAQAKALASWLNARGGVGGRKLALDFHRTTTGAVLSDTASVQQAACTRFLQDSKVDVVVSYLPNMYQLEECVAQRQVAVVRSYYGGRNDSSFQRFAPALRQPGAFSLDNGAVLLIDALGKKGYWKGQKVGWFLPDDTAHSALLTAAKVKQALSRNGINGVSTFRYNPTDVQKGSQDGASAVVRFRSDGVTRVILTGLASTTYFMNAASSQSYVPGYALTTDVAPSGSTITVTDQQQLAAVQGVGWAPTIDVGYKQITAKSKALQNCVEAFKAAGQDTTGDGAVGNGSLLCDALFFLDYALEGSAGSDAPEDIAAATAKVPTGYQSPLTQATDLRRPDGATAYQLFSYDSGAKVFRYTTNPERVSR